MFGGVITNPDFPGGHSVSTSTKETVMTSIMTIGPESAELKIAVENTTEQIMQFFEYEHLPVHLQEVAEPFRDLARAVIRRVPRNPERTVALRKMLEAKDAAVRAVIAK
jgi:hypothetical protein